VIPKKLNSKAAAMDRKESTYIWQTLQHLLNGPDKKSKRICSASPV
jgi:hypothetical protein